MRTKHASIKICGRQGTRRCISSSCRAVPRLNRDPGGGEAGGGGREGAGQGQRETGKGRVTHAQTPSRDKPGVGPRTTRWKHKCVQVSGVFTTVIQGLRHTQLHPGWIPHQRAESESDPDSCGILREDLKQACGALTRTAVFTLVTRSYFFDVGVRKLNVESKTSAERNDRASPNVKTPNHCPTLQDAIC